MQKPIMFALVLHEGASSNEVLAAVDKAIESETDPEKLAHLQDLRVRTATQQALAEARNDYLKVLPEMWQQFADTILSARKSENIDDWKDVKASAHRLKGSTGSYGLTQLSQICAKLEELIVSLDPRSHVLYDLLVSEINRCLAEAHKLVERASEEITELGPAEEAGFALLVVSPEHSGLTTKAIEIGTADSSLEIEYAHTAIGAITKCKAYIYDAVIIDLSLDSPEAPFELAKELRSLAGYLRKPFGFVTGENATDAAMMYGGCSVVLDENCTKADLSTMIARLHGACESQRPRILCIDDDESVTRFIEATLVDSGFAVRSLNEPIHAIEAAKEFGPDLILVDVMMPGISGFDVCRALKTHEAAAAAPVLFLTASCDGASRSCAFQAGAEDFVAKPIVRDELIARMKPYLPSTVDRLGPGGCALIEKSLFMDKVNQFVATQSGYGAVFLLSIDNIANLQARHGALAADQVSSMLTRLVSLRFRPEDLRTRLERDRLAVFVSGITPTQAEQIKAAVHQDIEAMHFAGSSGGRFQPQVSIHAAPIGTNQCQSESSRL